MRWTNHFCFGIFSFTIALSLPLAHADAFICKDTRGKVIIQDFPCDGSPRPYSTQPQKQSQQANSSPLDVSFQQAGFNGYAGYLKAREICMSIFSQYDFIGPIKKCALDNMQCINAASQESARMSQQMYSRTDWKANRCDLIIEIESSRPVQDDMIQKSINDEIFIINGNKFVSKTYCFGQEVDDRVVFIEGSRLGACVSAKFLNKRNNRVCDVWCE